MGSISMRARAAVIAVAVVAGMVPSAVAQAEPGGQAAGAKVSYEDAVPGLAPAGAPDSGVYLDRQGNRISEGPATGQVTPLLGCTPGSGRDNPHYSSGDVSGHGWWTKGSCSASTAHVINCLYEWYTDDTWRQKACSDTEKLKPYTGSGQRTVARATCNPTSGEISWRNHVDVDVDGQIDTPEEPYNQANVVCVVY